MAAICLGLNVLIHWGRVTHICVSNWTIIGSDNGLSPGRHQAIIWTNAGILLIRTLGTNFSEILSEIHKFSLKKMHLKTSPGKWRPFCLGLNMLTPFLFLIRVSISLFDLLVLWKEMQMTTYTFSLQQCQSEILFIRQILVQYLRNNRVDPCNLDPLRNMTVEKPDHVCIPNWFDMKEGYWMHA